MHRWLLPTALVLAAMPVSAEEESEKVHRARQENELEKEAESTDQKCGGKIAARIEWGGFDADARWKDKSISGYCEAPLGALRSFCEGANARALIAKKVRSFVCKAAKDKTAWRAEVKGEVLEWHVPPDAVNNDPYAKNQLLRAL
jgi:hypothetical protein